MSQYHHENPYEYHPLAPTWNIQDTTWREYHASVLDWIDQIYEFQQRAQLGPRVAILEALKKNGLVTMMADLPDETINNLRDFEIALLDYGPQNSENQENYHSSSSDTESHSDRTQPTTSESNENSISPYDEYDNNDTLSDISFTDSE